MAEIENKRSSGKRRRMKKKSTRVDLTPMVDLGFLLITFFVFTSTMSQPKAMSVIEPKDSKTVTDPICNSCALTVVLEKGGVIRYYEGMPEAGPVVQQTSFSVNGIRQVILDKKEKLNAALGNADRLVLIIKPAPESTMQHFVDMMDEVAINGIKHYYIADVDAADEKLLHLH
ncbi:MAG TPA: biopolymer transporter ExbD [Ferruginibacter sp.]|nr:biopolymer transporter ExbD [Chitinophagaceae bacterium]HRI24575.1 biopolymer transporter ExbD [Ferruginibacter sp.]